MQLQPERINCAWAARRRRPGGCTGKKRRRPLPSRGRGAQRVREHATPHSGRGSARRARRCGDGPHRVGSITDRERVSGVTGRHAVGMATATRPGWTLDWSPPADGQPANGRPANGRPANLDNYFGDNYSETTLPEY